MRLRYQGLTARDGWTPGEVREVEQTDAAPLLASGAWVVDLVAPRVAAPPLDRRVHGPGEGRK